MADSWDSIFKKQINLPEKELERKQSTLDNHTHGSKKQTLDEPINLSFLFGQNIKTDTTYAAEHYTKGRDYYFNGR